MLTQVLRQSAEYRKLLAAVQNGGCPAAMFGLPPVGRAHMLAALCRDAGRPVILICPGEAEATRFAEDLSALGVAAGVWPARDIVLRDIESHNHEYEYRRLQVLGNIVGGRVQVVCAGAEGAVQHTMPKAAFLQNTLTLRTGDTLAQDRLTAHLADAGYQRRDQVEGPGQFSVRGGIVDIWAPDMGRPARLEYWGDEVERIHAFDPMTQRRDAKLQKIHLSPAREVLFGGASAALAAISESIAAAPARSRAALAKAAEGELAALRAGVLPASLDKFMPLCWPQGATLLDYLPDALLVLDEPGAVREAIDTAVWRQGEEIQALLAEGLLAPPLTTFGEDYTALVRRALAGDVLLTDSFTRSLHDFPLKTLLSLTAHSLPVWHGVTADLVQDLQPLLAQGYACAVLAGTPRAAAGLVQDLAAAGLAAQAATDKTDTAPAPGCVAVLPGHISGGADFAFARWAVFTARAQGDTSPKKAVRRRQPGAFSSLEDLQIGDYVVHQTHGVGRYAGIKRLDIQGVVKDYLQISYDQSDILYVPVTQLDLLARYDIGEGAPVKLARLGGGEWNRTRARAKAATKQIAEELVQLYAKRQAAAGFAFAADTEWQRDFETRFEYDETDDQLLAIREIKRDMERPHPMDRLLCGDVGVGKTEVALRAAFKCVMSGKQAAILAPTTILAWQHYQTMLRRMEAFPVRIGLLNRFCTPAQQRQTVKDLASGVCDIVVGTHRLLQKDVQFKDLGLLIVDEEQRFGVHHKEKLKERFVGVDTLTLSATPIPRTLNMAMSGIRDMSSIQQPPVERQPVETYVLEYDHSVIAQAIRKELARGGQVYYLHNRIDSIQSCVGRVAQMAPDARIGVAHGRMEEKELSEVWRRLLDNELDVLVCTTIIEAGVDVRNCNTLIVEDADNLGLAQLYQIRGRVGRSGRKAYAYFTFRRDKVLTEISSKRLSAIREFTSFGSGLRIAMRDMQIRGVGSLLGASQHGHMQAVGYELYMKLLAQAMAEAKGETVAPDKSICTVDITVDAYIPQEYISTQTGRIEAYKRIAAIESAEDMQDVLEELADRYGPVPACVQGLVQVSFARVGAAQLGVTDINQKGDSLLFYSDKLDRALLRRLLPRLTHKAMVSASGRPYLAVALQDKDDVLALLRDTLAAWAAAAAEADADREIDVNSAGALNAAGTPGGTKASGGTPAAKTPVGAAGQNSADGQPGSLQRPPIQNGMHRQSGPAANGGSPASAPQGRLAAAAAKRADAAEKARDPLRKGSPVAPAHTIRAKRRGGR